MREELGLIVCCVEHEPAHVEAQEQCAAKGSAWIGIEIESISLIRLMPFNSLHVVPHSIDNRNRRRWAVDPSQSEIVRQREAIQYLMAVQFY